MKLDCIERQDGEWTVIDLDNDAKTICVAKTVDDAWYGAARKLEDVINGMLKGIKYK